MQSFQEQDYTKRFDLSLWRKLIKVAKPYHKNLIAVVLFMAVSAIIDVIMPNMNAYAIDVFIANHSTAGLVGFVVAYALLTAVQVATIFGFLRQCGIVETGTCYLIRKLGFQKLQELPFSYYDRMPVGYLMSRLTNDTQRLADTIGWSLVDLCWGAVYLVACAVRMLTINWRLGLIVMLVLRRWPSSAGSSRRRFSRRIVRCARTTARLPRASMRASTAQRRRKPLCAKN